MTGKLLLACYVYFICYLYVFICHNTQRFPSHANVQCRRNVGANLKKVQLQVQV